MKSPLTTSTVTVMLLAFSSCWTEANAQIWQLPHDEVTPGNHFGSAVAIDGDRLVIGASGEATCGRDSGAVYIYERDEHGAFARVERIEAASCEPGQLFGRLVALSSDVLAVGAGGELDFRRRNAVHVFERDSEGAWHESAVITAPAGSGPGNFASAIDLRGERLVVASVGDTAHRTFQGTAHVYERTGSGWVMRATLRPSRGAAFGIFGSNVAIAEDLIAVSASPYRSGSTGSVYVFERRTDGRWRKESVLTGFESPVVPVALAGPLLIVGEPGAGPAGAGSAAIFGRRDAGGWARLSTLRGNVPYEDGAFGTLVSADIGLGGARILVVGYTEQLGRGRGIDRVVHVFGYDGERGWRQRQVIDIGDWAFAMSLDVSGHTAVIGRASDDEPGVGYVVQLLP